MHLNDIGEDRSIQPSTGPVSDALYRTLVRRNLTAYRASKLSGVSVDAIQRFLNGQRGLNLESVDKLCIALGLRLVGDEIN